MAPEELRARAEACGQGHLFDAWDSWGDEARDGLLQELDSLDWSLLAELRRLVRSEVAASQPHLEPAPSIRKGEDPEADRLAEVRGEELLRAGRVAAFTVAGGQGSRLGFDGPKGLFPATPVRRAALFRLFAEKLAAASRRHRVTIPWYVMTSRANHDQTVRFFQENDYFGLPADSVSFFSRSMLPAMDREGRVLLDAPGRLFVSPNGHGGSLLALRDSGALDDMQERGVDQIFYFQVDNPLVVMVDPVFLGYHELAGADMSTKVVPKRDANEKVGVVGLIDGRYGVIEYSDLTPEQREARREDGTLEFQDGNIAIHAIRRAFVEELTRAGLDLPFHLARKNIPCISPDDGRRTSVPGIKFETFVFDALAHCESSVVLSVQRAEEFAPIKNAEGEDSPETSMRAQSALFASWLAGAGVAGADEVLASGAPIEIAPLFADSARALEERDLAHVRASPGLVLE